MSRQNQLVPGWSCRGASSSTPHLVKTKYRSSISEQLRPFRAARRLEFLNFLLALAQTTDWSINLRMLNQRWMQKKNLDRWPESEPLTCDCGGDLFLRTNSNTLAERSRFSALWRRPGLIHEGLSLFSLTEVSLGPICDQTLLPESCTSYTASGSTRQSALNSKSFKLNAFTVLGAYVPVVFTTFAHYFRLIVLTRSSQ